MPIGKTRKLIGSAPYGRELIAMRTIITAPDRFSSNHSKLNFLKIDRPDRRVWLSETGMVTEEIYHEKTGWIVTQRYNLQDLDRLIAEQTRVMNALRTLPSPDSLCIAHKTLSSVALHLLDCERCREFFVDLLRGDRRSKEMKKVLRSLKKTKA